MTAPNMSPNYRAFASLEEAKRALDAVVAQSDRYYNDRQALRKLLEHVLLMHNAGHGACCCAEIRVVLEGLLP